MENDKLALSIKECAKKLGISVSLCYELARTRQLPVIKCGEKRLLIPVKSLEAWLTANTNEGENAKQN